MQLTLIIIGKLRFPISKSAQCDSFADADRLKCKAFRENVHCGYTENLHTDGAAIREIDSNYYSDNIVNSFAIKIYGTQLIQHKSTWNFTE